MLYIYDEKRGTLGLLKANPEKFDLVITDLTMPMLTGDRLAAELKKLNPDIPVILCTGFSERITPEIAASMGIDGFVRKTHIETGYCRFDPKDSRRARGIRIMPSPWID